MEFGSVRYSDGPVYEVTFNIGDQKIVYVVPNALSVEDAIQRVTSLIIVMVRDWKEQ